MYYVFKTKYNTILIIFYFIPNTIYFYTVKVHLPLKITKENKHQTTMNELHEAPCLIFSILASENKIHILIKVFFLQHAYVNCVKLY
jgi:hypothetical protein